MKRSATAWLTLCGFLMCACSTTPDEPPVEIRPKSSLLSNRSKIPEDAPAAAEDLPTVLAQGETARKFGKNDEALYYSVKAIELDPKNVKALVQIGQIHLDKGNYDLAELAFRMARQNAPKNVDALEGLGLVQLHDHAYKEAEVSFIQAVAIDRRRWRSHNGLGLIADLDGRHGIALGHFQQALKERPNDPELLNNIGYSKYLAGNWTGAQQSLDAALQADPRHESAWLNKGLILARQGREKAALDAFMAVLDEADAYNNLGFICMQEGRVDSAEQYFERAIAASPSYHASANENLRRLRSAQNEKGGL